MSFGAAGFLAAGGVAALGVLALHFIVMRQPPSAVFPTARFLPPRPAVSRTVARVPADLLLLAARIAAVMCVSAAFARPILKARTEPVANLVVVDRSRDVAIVREVADSAKAVLASVAGPQVVVLFDSSVRIIDAGGADSLANLQRTEAEGNVSAGLIGALRAAARLRDQADSMTLTLVSPLTAAEADAATDSIRALWPGAVRLVRVGASRADSGGVAPTVDWPADGHAAGMVARAPADTVGALVATGSGGVVLVAPFARTRRFDSVGRGVRVVLRWVDGEPAALERAAGTGCVRRVGVPIPAEGDLVLRAGYQRLAEAMHAPCGRAWGEARRVPAAWDTAGPGARPWRVATARLTAGQPARSPFAVWLLVAGAALLFAEPLLRGRRAAGERTSANGEA